MVKPKPKKNTANRQSKQLSRQDEKLAKGAMRQAARAQKYQHREDMYREYHKGKANTEANKTKRASQSQKLKQTGFRSAAAASVGNSAASGARNSNDRVIEDMLTGGIDYGYRTESDSPIRETI